ncbi:MAG: signal peptidase I [Bacteroidaceae bacterium]|nr:signal peptidase I [Bacteroidaceae bacterium]
MATKKKHTLKPETTTLDWVRGIIACGLLIAFLIWIKSWWGALALPFVFDAYVTRFINWGWWKELENPVTRMLMSWIDAIVFALVAVYFVNIYFFQNYTIPSSSLEKSLLIGDYLFVSKTSYGPRAPMTPFSMPLCQNTLPFGNVKSYLSWPQWKYKRISPKRVPLNDIVVFNYPAGDTVALDPRYQAADYYMLSYLYGQQIAEQNNEGVDIDALSPLERYRYYEHLYALGSSYIKQSPGEFGEVGSRPVDRRENYVKRCVGTPGQTLEIRDRIIYLDGKPNKEPDEVQYNYQVTFVNRTLPEDLVKELGLSQEDLFGSYGRPGAYQTGVLPLTKKVADVLRSRPDQVASIEIIEQTETDALYPLNGHRGWTCDNYGPIWIPAKGESIQLTLDNLPIYERPIKVYEGNDLQVTGDGKILINGKEATEYTFQMDYYWMMGDNRHNSADSRYWGFVPEDHVVGKPIMIWLSMNKDYSLFNGGIRWNRLFRWVDNIK